MLIEDVSRIFREAGDGRVRVVDRADDDKGVDFDRARVRLVDEVAQRIDGRVADRLSPRLERVEVP